MKDPLRRKTKIRIINGPYTGQVGAVIGYYDEPAPPFKRVYKIALLNETTGFYYLTTNFFEEDIETYLPVNQTQVIDT